MFSPQSSFQTTSNVTQMPTGTINPSTMKRHIVPCNTDNHRTQQTPHRRLVVPAQAKTVPAVVKANSLSSLVSVTDGKKTDTAAVSAHLTAATITAPAVAVAKSSKHLSSNPPTVSNQHQTSKTSSTTSKFVWVKTQNVESEVQQSSCVATPAGKTVKDFQSSTSASESTAVHSVCKKTAAKKPPQKITQDSLSKTSKYRWVSSTASQAKGSRKSLSPKVLSLPQKGLETCAPPKRVKAVLMSPAMNKKEVAASSRSSRYSWKATAAGGARSSFYWAPDKRNKGVRGGFSPGTLRTSLPSPSSSPGAFKLRSRMKIIRRSVNVILPKPHETENNPI